MSTIRFWNKWSKSDTRQVVRHTRSRTLKPRLATEWLRQKAAATIRLSLLGSVGCLLLGLAVCWLTHWAFYVVIFLFLPRNLVFSLGLPGDPRHTLAWICVGLTFLGRIALFRRQLEHYEFESGPSQGVAVSVARVTGQGWLALAAGPKTFLSFCKLLASLVCLGPAILQTSVTLVATAVKLYRLDAAVCGPMISTLYRADAKVPFETLFEKHPAADPSSIVLQLQCLDGVILRTSAPPGISLAAHLRGDIEQWLQKHSKSHPADT
jgi:hypothetical protein